jgi:predicted Zn-ribbon and HTH transcriptional regulator
LLNATQVFSLSIGKHRGRRTTMSVIQKLKSVLPGDDGTVTTQRYECQECGHVFESAKSLNRARCGECFSNDVTAQ